MKKKSFLIYELQCLRILTVISEVGLVATANILKKGDEGRMKFRLCSE